MAEPWSMRDLDPAELKRLVDAGYSSRQIAELYGVSRQTIDNHRKRAGLSKASEPRLDHKQVVPWVVTTEHHGDSIYRGLRAYSKFHVHGQKLNAIEQGQMDKVLAHVESRNVVVNYDQVDGWSFVPREEQDGNGIIRRPTP